jgi:polyhydroxyalkanoate depolymerase
MPTSFLTAVPQVVNSMEIAKLPIKTSSTIAELSDQLLSYEFELIKDINDTGWSATRHFLPWTGPFYQKTFAHLFGICHESTDSLIGLVRDNVTNHISRFHQERQGELEFISLFTDELPPQDWIIRSEHRRELLDLPSLKLIDISADLPHAIQNYTVVFAPRAGHHSNIAEQVAVYMRDQGMTRMAVVEQKCAEDIPLYVNGQRHHEDFESQIEQYRQILEHVRTLTGHPAHLVAICQPGPLLLLTLILHPELGKTFGSAGAPMHTEGESGYLTDFARNMGENYIDNMIALFCHTVSDEHVGVGRKCFDGRLQVLGFYLLGMDQHMANFKNLLSDLKEGNRPSAERQKVFYQWYNYVHHFPTSFMRDTYKRIFIRNELIRGTLNIGGRTIGIKDYPVGTPIWAIGGKEDQIAPPLQATGHMDFIDGVAPEDKLTLICEGGHMGLFRSNRILRDYYSRIVRFLLDRSDIQAGE